MHNYNFEILSFLLCKLTWYGCPDLLSIWFWMILFFAYCLLVHFLWCLIFLEVITNRLFFAGTSWFLVIYLNFD